jgi:hypothetical protein
MNTCGTLPLRAWRIFNTTRKIWKRHQNVLVFYKWDLTKIKDNYKPFEKIEELIEKEIAEENGENQENV